MDTATLATSLAGASATQTRNAISASIIRMDARMAAGLADMLARNADRANALVADGIGGNVDISA
ncbi:MAG: hypothetical protein AB7O39_16880 [Flavobacteriaceae bacterium]